MLKTITKKTLFQNFTIDNANQSNSVNGLFSLNTFNVSSMGTAVYLYVKDFKTGSLSSYDWVPTNNIVFSKIISSYVVSNGLNSYEFIASPGSIDSNYSVSVAKSLSNTQQILDALNATIECPMNISLSDYFYCDIKLNGGGSNLEVKVDYDDGTQINFSPIGN